MAVYRTARSTPHLIIVDANPAQREALARLADTEGIPATACASLDEARATLARLHEQPSDEVVVVPVGTSLEDAGRALILATLQQCGGVRKRAAEMLGISLKTLYNRLVAYRSSGLLGAGGAPKAGEPVRYHHEETEET